MINKYNYKKNNNYKVKKIRIKKMINKYNYKKNNN